MERRLTWLNRGPWLLVLASLAFVLACASSAAPPSVGKGGGASPSGLPFALPAPAAPFPSARLTGQEDRASSSGLPSQERKIVRNINMVLVVKDIQEALNKIAGIASKFDGFVVSSSRQGQNGDSRGHITIRVAAQDTDKALVDIRGAASRVESESGNSQDVTEEFVDLQARLKNLNATEEQLLAIMQKATTVEDILKVQKELSNVRGELERIKGRLQFLERTSATSLISIELTPLASAEPLVRPGWNALETAKDALRGFSETAQTLASALIWVAIFTPVWGVPLAAVALALWRFGRWRRRKQP